jgi:hypothetical protein
MKMDVTTGFWTSLGALLLLSMLLGAVTTVVDSVLDTIQVSGIIKKLPIIGSNWNLIVAIAMMAVIDIDVVGGWGVGSESWVMPAPIPKVKVEACDGRFSVISIVRMGTLKAKSPPGSSQPRAPQ